MASTEGNKEVDVVPDNVEDGVLQGTCSGWIWTGYMHPRGLDDCGEYASKWLGRLWRTKGSDFESVVDMFWVLYFQFHFSIIL